MDKILIIDDDKAYAETLTIFLSGYFNNVSYVTGGEEALGIIRKNPPDVVITDLIMPDMDGLEVLSRIKEYDMNIAVIIITAFNNTESIIRAMQLGAYDYFDKSSELKKIKFVVEKTLALQKNKEKMVIALEDKADSLDNYMIGDSIQMREIFKKIGRISSTRVNVLIQGESGTGKELITRMIHSQGVTKNEPFVAVNCSALSETLIESELFGHVQGAFTGATRTKKGKFELAGKGTIFLDEISEFSPKLQVKLLRVIQEREIERVGGEETIPVMARIVAATNKNLYDMVQKGEFREDLYYRLNIFTINVPPLRERKDEIYKLVIHFLKKINNELHKRVNVVPYEVMEMLISHKWVGNVRELENTLMNAVLLSKSNILEKECITFAPYAMEKNLKNHKLISLAEAEKEHIKYVLEHVNWNKNKASKVLGITKTTLYSKIAHYNLMKLA